MKLMLTVFGKKRNLKDMIVCFVLHYETEDVIYRLPTHSKQWLYSFMDE